MARHKALAPIEIDSIGNLICVSFSRSNADGPGGQFGLLKTAQQSLRCPTGHNEKQCHQYCCRAIGWFYSMIIHLFSLFIYSLFHEDYPEPPVTLNTNSPHHWKCLALQPSPLRLHPLETGCHHSHPWHLSPH